VNAKSLTDMARIILSIVTSIAAAGCAHHAGSGSTPGRCASEAAATESALRVLEEKGRTSEYFTDRAKLTDEDGHWNVSFTRREYAFPGQCLIKVRKLDCDAAWSPLK
jgi:hypothetical protein